MSRLHLNVGKKNKMTPKMLMSIINRNCSAKNVEIGEIDVLRNFSFFNIDTNVAESVAKDLTGVDYKGEKLYATFANPNTGGGGRSKDSGRRNDGGRRFEGGKRNGGGAKRKRRKN